LEQKLSHALERRDKIQIEKEKLEKKLRKYAALREQQQLDTFMQKRE